MGVTPAATVGSHAVTKEISISITGTNDAPVVSAAVKGNANEDGITGTLDALANATDPDNGTVLGVVDLALPEQLIEIAAIAVVPEQPQQT